jgi:hypothetical protein
LPVEPNALIEITLSDKFCVNENEDYLKLLFSNEKITNGGEITSVQYMPEQLKAYVKYEHLMVAERVERKRFIDYNSYKFIVRYAATLPVPNTGLFEMLHESKTMPTSQSYAQRTYVKHSDVNDENNFDSNNGQQKQKESTNVKTIMFVKDLKNNRFLRLILSKTNSAWRKEIFAELESSCNCKPINYSEHKIILKPVNDNRNDKNWHRNIENELKKFVQQFAPPKPVDKNLNEELIQTSINEFNKSHPNSVGYVNENSEFFIIAKTSVAEQFYLKSPIFAQISHVDIPDFVKRNCQKIIEPIIKKFTQTFGGTYDYKTGDGKISVKNLDSSVLGNIVEKLNKALSQIQVKHIKTDYDKILMNCNQTQITCILDSFFKPKNRICFFNVNPISCISLVYLHDFAELNCDSNVVFDEVQKLFNAYFTVVSIEISTYKDLIKTQKWNDFRIKTMNDCSHRDKLVYTLYNSQSLIIFGLKECVFPMKDRVQSFFDNNDVVTKKVDLTRDEVRFFFLIV